MSLTQTDIDNSGKFAESNNRIRLIRALYMKAPHLASHLKYTIRPATDQDYYVPLSLAKSAKVVDVEITDRLCRLVSCNPAAETDMCTPEMKASYYYVGDDSWDVQCQPACFNTAAKPTYDEDTKLRSPDTPMLNFHNGKCRLVNASMTSYLEKTFYRSSTHYENRVNDMPTGFSRRDDTANPYGSGWQYVTNPTYCAYYDRHYEPDGSCEMTFWEKLLDSFIGMSLINTIRSSIRMITNDGKPFDPPTGLPPLPSQLPPEFASVDGWRANIDESFVVPELIDTTPNKDNNNHYYNTMTTTTMTTTTTGGGGKRKKKKRDIDDSTTTTTSAETEDDDNDNDDDGGDGNENIHEFRRRKEMEQTTDEMSTFMRSRCGLPPLPQKEQQKERRRRQKRSVGGGGGGGGGGGDDDDETWVDKMYKILLSLLKSATTDPNFWLNIGVNAISDAALDSIKALCKRIIEKLSVYATGEMLKIGSAVGSKILSGTLRGIAVRMVSSLVVRIGSKLAIMLAKITAAAASVIGWLLIGAMLLDLLFTFWDPYGYNNLFPPEMPRVLNDNGQLSFRKALESATCNFEFESFFGTVLSQDEILALQIESFTDRLIYLDSLVVNSEGSRIDKGDEIDTGGPADVDDMETARNRAMAERATRFDPANYETYNRRFFIRTRVNGYANLSAVACCTLALGFGLLRLYLLAVFLLLLALFVLAAARYELQGDLAVESIDELGETSRRRIVGDLNITVKDTPLSSSSSSKIMDSGDTSILSGYTGQQLVF